VWAFAFVVLVVLVVAVLSFCRSGRPRKPEDLQHIVPVLDKLGARRPLTSTCCRAGVLWQDLLSNPTWMEDIVVRVDVVVLPGIGALRAFRTESNDKIAVLALRSGRRQLFVENPSDPDDRQLVAELGERDAQVLAELLGGPLLQLQAGSEPDALTLLEWVRVPPGSAGDGVQIRELALRKSVGATIVAVLRGDEVFADPAADFTLRAHDVAVISGAPGDLPRGRQRLTAPRQGDCRCAIASRTDAADEQPT
jgi:TrkA domain protein